MLVLARQRDETIVIFDDILVTVVDIRGDKVRLGISAPKNVPVDRKEIYDVKKRESQSTAPTTGPDPMLAAAVDEAKASLAEGGLPIGAIFVRGDQIIARGHDRRVQRGQPIACAEVECLNNAGKQTNYKDTILYCTLTPSLLGGAAIAQLGIPKVIVGDAVHGKGASHLLTWHGIKIVDLADPACSQMVADFIAAHPELWDQNGSRQK